MRITSIFDFFWRVSRDNRARSSPPDGPTARKARAHWWAGSVGIQGPQAFDFEVRRLGVRLPHAAGVFLICVKEAHGGWTPLLAGETQDLDTRVRSHELMPEVLLLGATHIHFVPVRKARAERIALAGQIVHAYDPPLNRPGAKGFMQSIDGTAAGHSTVQALDTSGTAQTA